MPNGFRWIAVRPGPPPPPRRPPSPLGPTPRYRAIPRWGLIDRFVPAGPTPTAHRRTPSDTVVRATLLAAAAVFAVAAAVHVVRYLLLLVNRTRLLPPLIADGVLLVGVLASLAAIVAVIATAAITTSWLIGRRAAVFGLAGQPDPRPEWSLWAGCLVPVVNLVWAPIFVVELARAEHLRSRQRVPIATWWVAWVVTTLVCAWAAATSSADQPQAIADNTVTVIIGYLCGLATLLLLWRVFDGFVRKPVERPAHRWVVLGGDDAAARPPARTAATEKGPTETENGPSESVQRVESGDREPAA